MSSKKQLPTGVILAVLAAITVIAWIGFEAFRAYSATPEPTVPEEVSLPLDPSLDTTTLSLILARIKLEESEIGETKIVTPVTESDEEEEAIVPTSEEAEVQETEE